MDNFGRLAQHLVRGVCSCRWWATGCAWWGIGPERTGRTSRPNRARKSEHLRARRCRLRTMAGWAGGQSFDLIVREYRHRARTRDQRIAIRARHPVVSPEPKPAPLSRDLRWAGMPIPLCPRPHRADLAPTPTRCRQAPRLMGGSLIAVSRSRRKTCRTTVMSPLHSRASGRPGDECDRAGQRPPAPACGAKQSPPERLRPAWLDRRAGTVRG
jgi:hypothetical protein